MKKKNLSFITLTASLAAALALSACGGGGGGGDSTPDVKPTPIPGSVPGYTVAGFTTAINADPLETMYLPANATSSTISGTFFTSNSAPKAAQNALPSGAYATVASANGTAVALLAGASGPTSSISIAYGDSNVTLGRWTAGSVTVNGAASGTVTPRGASHYLVGLPLTLPATGTGTLNCSLLGATNPTAASNSIDPGTVTDATGTLDLATQTLTFTAHFNIGNDTGATVSRTGAGMGTMLGSGAYTSIAALGLDATKPDIAIAWASTTPTSGDANGILVLKCGQ